MITCTLNNQKYSIDFVSGRALREMEPAAKMYGRIVALSALLLYAKWPHLSSKFRPYIRQVNPDE